MHSFEEFFTHMSSQLPDRLFCDSAEPTPEQSASLKAVYLWSLLQIIHDDLNSLCRRNPNGNLGPMSIAAIHRAFEQVEALLGDSGAAGYLVQMSEQPTHADALVIVSLYRSALRWYRVNQLKEDPFTIA
ncbi:MAG TPA: hypothetical protein V6D22_22610 [Candidatus Obscuribacterales bacterium]